MIEARDVTVIAPMRLEANALRRECPHLRIVESGIALANVDPATLGDTVISYGLAGGLLTSLPTGSVLIPREVERPNGERVACDPPLQRALAQSARQLGVAPIEGPMITSTEIVHGDARRRLGARGLAGVDMESGLLTAPRIAVIRVILDTPQRELSDSWVHPAKALMNPFLWPEAVWLARNATPCARLAARILSGAFASPLSS